MSRSCDIGVHVARRCFEVRGNHPRVYLKERELARLLALAAELGKGYAPRGDRKPAGAAP
jgi:hypothetical protein